MVGPIGVGSPQYQVKSRAVLQWGEWRADDECNSPDIDRWFNVCVYLCYFS